MNAWPVIICVLGVLLGGRAVGAGALPSVRSTDEIAALIEGAEPGATVRVPAGTYAGRLRIGRPVVLEGGGRVVIDGEGVGTVVTIGVEGVTFRGFTVRGSASRVDGEPAGIRAEAGPVVIEDNRVEDALFGIDLRPSPGSIVRRNTIVGMALEPGRRGDGIRLWWSHGSTVEDNVVSESRDMVFWYSEALTIRRNRVSNSRYGLHFMYSHDTVVEGNVLRRNSVGIYLMYSNGIDLRDNTLAENRGPSGYGLGLKDCDDIGAIGNSFLANRVGIYIDNTPSSVGAEALIEGNTIAFNELGMLVTPNTRGGRVLGNGFIENEEQVGVHGRGELEGNAFAEGGRGNFWSDYAGFDRDADGIGDFPYEAASLFESLLAREPNLRLFVHSPAQQAIEFTARALPEVRPAPKFVDAHPLMSPPRTFAAPVEPGSRLAMLGVGGAMIGVGVFVALAGSRRSALALVTKGASQ